MRPRLMDVEQKSEMADVRPHFDDFDVFYSACWQEVYRPLAVTLRDPGLAREAVDEAMSRAVGRWREVRSFENQAGWVYRVAFNWAISQLRRRRREVRTSTSLESSWQPNVPDIDLFRALGRLDPRHRSVLVLRFLMDWTEAEIAEALGVPKGTVKSRMTRGLAKLRKDLL